MRSWVGALGVGRGGPDAGGAQQTATPARASPPESPSPGEVIAGGGEVDAGRPVEAPRQALRCPGHGEASRMA